MKTFDQVWLNFVGIVIEGNSDQEDEMTIDIVSDLHSHSDQQLVGYSDVIGTVTEEDNSDEEYEMETAVSESQPPHDDRQLVSYPDSDSGEEPCNSKQQPILDKEIDLVLASK